jgi:ElaB/YqjD/DUF883 family membrane-anchored ribosome-binding protein
LLRSIHSANGGSMLQLRRVKDQVFNRRAGDKLAGGLAEVRDRMEEVREQGSKVARKTYERGNQAARTAYDYAMNHPKSTAAVVLGAGIAAGLLWMVQRSGGYAAVRQKVMQRVRRTAATKRSRRQVTNATE